MNSSDDDPDFVFDAGSRSSSPARSDRSRSGTPFLRSSCHHHGPCHEGHGLQFHTRITPSPARSHHRRSRSRRNSRFSTDSPVTSANVASTSEVINAPESVIENPASILRRNLSAQLEEAARTTALSTSATTSTSRNVTSLRTRTWVEQQSTSSYQNESFHHESVTSTSFNGQLQDQRRSLLRSRANKKSEMFSSKLTKDKMTSDYYSSQSSDAEQSTTTPKRLFENSGESSSSSIKGSPRLKAFEGRAWIRSPRTGYTYVNGPTYRNVWTPDREIPMPHMARLPLDSYDDGEVSFSRSVKRRLFYSSLNNEFSDDEENYDNVVTDVSSDKKSVVGKFFYSFVSLLLFPFLIVYRLCAKTVEIVHKTFSHFFSFLRNLTSRIFQRWESAKVNYNNFMTTNVVETTTEVEELLTDDESERDDSQFKVPHTSQLNINRHKEKTRFFSRIFQYLYTIKSLFSTTTATTTTTTTTSSNTVVDGNEEETSWIEIVIIRRIVRIFRYFSSTILQRQPAVRNESEKPVSDVIADAAEAVHGGGGVERGVEGGAEPLHDRLLSATSVRRVDNQNNASPFSVTSSQVYKSSRNKSKNVAMNITVDQHEHQLQQEPDFQETNGFEVSKEENVVNKRPSLFRPLAWVVSLLSLPRLPSRRTRWRSGKRRRYFGPPTRRSLRLKGLPAENFGDLPKTQRRNYQRKRVIVSQEGEEIHFTEEVTFEEPSDHEGEQLPESYLEWILFHFLDFFGYFNDDDETDREFDEEDELIETRQETGQNRLQSFFTRLLRFVRTISVNSLILLTVPFQLLSLPTLPPRKRSRREKQFRAGTRSSLRLKGLAAESSGYYQTRKKRTKRVQQVLQQHSVIDPSFSDNEEEIDETFVDDNEFETETFAQRCLNCLLDFFGYFEYDEDFEQETDLEPETEKSRAFFGRVISVLSSPFFFCKSILLATFSSFISVFTFPSRDFQWRKTKDGKYFRVGTRQSLRLRSLPAEHVGDLITTKRKRRERRPAEEQRVEEDVGQQQHHEEEIVEERMGFFSVFFYSLLDRFGYFEQLEAQEEQQHDELDEDVSERVETASLLSQCVSAILFPMKLLSSTISTFSLLPARSYQWRKTKEGKYFRVGSRQSLRLRGLPAEDLHTKMTKRKTKSSLESDETADEEHEEHEVGRLQIFFYSILDRFGYFERLSHTEQSEPEVEDSHVTNDTDRTSWIQSLFRTLAIPFFYIGLICTNVWNLISSPFTFPEREFQWKKNKDGKYVRVGSRKSLRLRGIGPEPGDLPVAASRRKRGERSRFDPGFDHEEDFEVEEEVIGIFRRIFISTLNYFGYFDQLEVPADGIDENEVPVEGDASPSFWGCLTSVLSSPFVLLKSVFVPSFLKDGAEHEESVVATNREEDLSVQQNTLGMRRSRRTRSTLVRSLEDEDRETEVEIAVLKEPWYLPFWKFLLASMNLIAFPFLWLWQCLCSSAEFVSSPFKKSSKVGVRQSSRLKGKPAALGELPLSSRKMRRSKNLRVESDVSEDDEEQEEGHETGSFGKMFGFFNKSASFVETTENKSYVEIPTDSFVNDEMEHETFESGKFISKKFLKRKEEKHQKVCLCLLPLILLPLLLFFGVCWVNPELLNDQICQNSIEHSSQFFESFTSRLMNLGKTVTLFFSDSCQPFLTQVYENSVYIISRVTDQAIDLTKGSLSYLSYGATLCVEVFTNIFVASRDFIFLTAESAASKVIVIGDVFKSTFESLFNISKSETSTSTESKTFYDYFSTLIFSTLYASYNACLTCFSAILYLLTWTWSCLWSAFAKILFFFLSIGQWFSLLLSSSSSTADIGAKTLQSDLIVNTILESRQFRDYVSQATSEQLNQDQLRYEQHLEEVYRRFLAKFDNEKAGIDLSLQTNEQELNLLRQSILNKLDSLAKEQSELSDRIKEQEKSKIKDDQLIELGSKLELLKDDFVSYQETDASEAGRNQLESRLTDLQLRIEKLESDLASIQLEAKRCCRNDTFIRELVTTHLEKWLKEDFGRWNDSTILLRDNLESTLLKVADDLRRDILTSTTDQLRHLAEGETEKTVELILSDVVSRITSKNLTKIVHENVSSPSDFLAREEIEKMVRNALVIYDADKTGLFDFALETAGGAVVSTRCTETYVQTSASYTLFGIPIWWPSNNPRTAIQPGVLPGECWAFKGSQGYLVIELSSPMRPTRFSVEHIPRSMSPNGHIDSAPKDFVVFGLETSEQDPNPVNLGRFTYDDTGDPIQFFEVSVEHQTDRIFMFIELNIISNHGNINYTCLYRFRVHGDRGTH